MNGYKKEGVNMLTSTKAISAERNHLMQLETLMSCGVLAVSLLFSMVSDAASPTFVDVNADKFFNSTGILASPGESFLIKAKGEVDISALNGGYITEADGAIAVTPQHDSGAFVFFRDTARPIDTDPVEGSRKSFFPLGDDLPGHLPGAPYGALVAGFSGTAHPASFADFSNGFALIGHEGIARAPSTGGYLFLGVNDFNNPGGDNAGVFRVRVFQHHVFDEHDDHEDNDNRNANAHNDDKKNKWEWIQLYWPRQ